MSKHNNDKQVLGASDIYEDIALQRKVKRAQKREENSDDEDETLEESQVD